MGGKLKRGLVEALVLAVVAGIILFAGWGLSKSHAAEKSYTPTNLIRLHIIGNSDEKADQEVKLMVRDVIMTTFANKLVGVKDAREAETVLSKLLPEIERAASNCLEQNGFGYRARAAIKTLFFPDRIYETRDGSTIVLPEGRYRALQIVLGEGKGRNWWCVMYPPLCYFDLVKKTGPEVPAFKDARIDLIIDELSTKEAHLEVRFFFVEAFKNGVRYLSELFPPRFSIRMCPGLR
ncbi:MAG: stage II sporulation protein R [Candidatus Fermentithermobacillus carboniphilus]|uniref:Stage II sporulation protein R n=1 Tax=Candidatus Fermentithermobacillus carboniphilus TaxID=3085328 RepID=A0AAT9LBS5_9FIRM|nr:MAG: stage II sporulation protein R [Candidatus Fermentithermobacillus carboniphilus]